MKNIKSYFIIALTLASFTGTVIGMEGEREQPRENEKNDKGKEKDKKKKKKALMNKTKNKVKKTAQKFKKKAQKTSNTIQETLLGKSPVDLLILPEEFSKDIQNEIFKYAMQFTSSDTLFLAINTINALTLINKEMNALFNDDDFIVQLIDHIALTFGVWKETVASLLTTPAAKRYLQEQFKVIGTTDKNDLFLLEDDSINIDIPMDNEGSTILMLSIQTLDIPKIKALLNNKRININKQNNDGNTALHITLLKILETTDENELSSLKKIALELIKYKKASLKIKNNDKISPNLLLTQIEDKEFLNQIKMYILREYNV